MFFNNPQRKKSIGLNEEYAKIIEVVTRYAVHYPLIKFSCRKVSILLLCFSYHYYYRWMIRRLMCLPIT